MPPTTLDLLRQAYASTHARALQLAARVTDAQAAWQPNATTPSMAFHLWHMARWADHLQAALPGMHPTLRQRLGDRPQLWERDRLAQHWQLPEAERGLQDTGMGLDPNTPLALPARDALLDYVRGAFAAVEEAAAALDDDLFLALEEAQPLTGDLRSEGTTIGAALVSHVLHENRHLGMLECLVGLQGQAGSATV